MPKQISLHRDIYEWDPLENFYAKEDGEDLLELSKVYTTPDLLEMDVDLIEEKVIEEQTIDIDSIEEIDTTKTFDYSMTDVLEWNNEMEEKINQTIRAVKHLNKEIQSIKEGLVKEIIPRPKLANKPSKTKW